MSQKKPFSSNRVLRVGTVFPRNMGGKKGKRSYGGKNQKNIARKVNLGWQIKYSQGITPGAAKGGKALDRG